MRGLSAGPSPARQRFDGLVATSQSTWIISASSRIAIRRLCRRSKSHRGPGGPQGTLFGAVPRRGRDPLTSRTTELDVTEANVKAATE